MLKNRAEIFGLKSFCILSCENPERVQAFVLLHRSVVRIELIQSETLLNFICFLCEWCGGQPRSFTFAFLFCIFMPALIQTHRRKIKGFYFFFA